MTKAEQREAAGMLKRVDGRIDQGEVAAPRGCRNLTAGILQAGA